MPLHKSSPTTETMQNLYETAAKPYCLLLRGFTGNAICIVATVSSHQWWKLDSFLRQGQARQRSKSIDAG
jgi:hypothetical protein